MRPQLAAQTSQKAANTSKKAANTSQKAANTSKKAALWMLGGALAFSLMGVCTKYGAHYFNSGELVFYRGIFGVLFVLTWMHMTRVSPKTQYPWHHAWRSICGTIALSAWFYGLAHLPLATAMTLNYTSTLWIAAFVTLGALLFGKAQQAANHQFQAWLLVTITLGFLGVVMLLRPSFESGQGFAGAVGLFSGIASSLAYLQVAGLTRRGEPESRIVLYFACATVVGGAVTMCFMGTAPASVWTGWGWLWLLPMGLFASFGQICMTKAYASGHTLLVANLNFSGIVFSALLGIAFFGDLLPLSAWFGMCLIIVSGVAATLIRAKQSPTHTPVAKEL